MTITVTVSTLFERGLWLKACDITGISEWAVNEGQMDSNDTVTLSEVQAKELGIIHD